MSNLKPRTKKIPLSEKAVVQAAMEHWETVIDFTKSEKGGTAIEDILPRL